MQKRKEKFFDRDTFKKDKEQDVLIDLQSQYEQICEILTAEDKVQKKEFIAMASHELKTPLTILKIYSQILHEVIQKKGDDFTASLFLRMVEQIDKLTLLVEDMLDINKLTERKLTFQREIYNMNDLIFQVVHVTQLAAVTHVIEMDLGEIPMVFGDKEKTSKVLTNLLSNAIKYSPRSEKIIVTSTSTDKEITVCVKDFGIGISEKMQKHLFSRFFRVIDESTKTFPGLGLGLFSATEIIQQQDGQIWVDSSFGEGSAFYFSLPYSS